MTILIAIGIALIAIFVLVSLAKLAFNLIVLGIGLAVAIGAYVMLNKMLAKGR